MTIYTITLTQAQDDALGYAAVSQDSWIQNAVSERCRVAMDEIVQIAVAKCFDTGTPVPATKDETVELAFAKGWVKSAADRQAEIQTTGT